jgi:hemerythrin-like domain-containing protein
MKEIIAILAEDHKKIDAVISNIKRLMTLPPEESFVLLEKDLNFFQSFTFKGHHLRENEVLYTWMGKQNPNSDTTLMERIKLEHEQLENAGNILHASIVNFLKGTPGKSAVAILSDLNDFVVIYLEHIEKEENFIFMIAEGLQLSKEEQDNMLNRMKKTF